MSGILPDRSLLDIGCGTGEYDIFYDELGASVVGMDLNRRMLNLAKYKIEQSRKDVTLCNGIAENLPFKSHSFDIVTCCGDVLNYVDDFNLTIDEMLRVLRPKGYVVLGFSNKISFDLFWEFMNCIFYDRLKYGTSFTDSIDNLIDFDIIKRKNYPVVMKHGIEFVSLLSPTKASVEKVFTRYRVQTIRTYGICTIMNVLPYILLSDPNGPSCVKQIGKALSKVDAKLINNWIAGNFATELLVFGRKN